MGSDIIEERQWRRAADGKISLRQIEEWRSGLTEHGDVVLGFITRPDQDPALPAGEASRSQFICTREDARAIAETILRALAFSTAPDGDSFAAFRDRIRAPALRALADDWNEARGQRRMPAWKDINPDLSAPYLACMWGFDRDPASGEFTGRVAGRNLMRTFRRNFLGTRLRDLYPPPVFEQAQAGLVRVLSQPGCCLLSGRLFRAGDTVVAGERLLLPIGADPAHPDGVLGASWHDNDLPEPASDGIELLYDKIDWCQL